MKSKMQKQELCRLLWENNDCASLILCVWRMLPILLRGSNNGSFAHMWNQKSFWPLGIVFLQWLFLPRSGKNLVLCSLPPDDTLLLKPMGMATGNLFFFNGYFCLIVVKTCFFMPPDVAFLLRPSGRGFLGGIRDKIDLHSFLGELGTELIRHHLPTSEKNSHDHQ